MKDCAASTSDRKALMKTPDRIPEGILKALIPEDRSERTMICFRLRQAGFDGPNSVRNFFILRFLLAMCAPLIAVLVFSVREFVSFPSNVDEYLNSFTKLRVMQIVAVIVQSMEYGTSISEAMNSYAIEMRETREMKAQ